MMNGRSYDDKVHMIGRWTLTIGLLLTFLPPMLIWLVYGIFPPIENLVNGIISISVVMLPVSLVEILTFSPMLGSSAMYMSYLTGNITNIKMPSAAIAMEVVKVEPSSEEGDIISTLAIAGSVVATELIVILSVLLIVPLSVHLNHPMIQPAFAQILPALFGAVGAYYILKEWRLAVAPLLVAIALNLVSGLPTAITIPITVLISVLVARALYQRGQVIAVSS